MSFLRYPAYKDSGVEWLGEVPAHWSVVPVKAVAEVINGFPFDSALFHADDGVPLVRIRDLNCAETEAKYTGEFIERAAITSDDVLIGMDGDFNVGRWLGAGQALLNQRMCCIRGRDALMTRFLEYSLPAPLRVINAIAYSTTVKHLSSAQVEQVRVSIPNDKAELTSVVTFLDAESDRILSLRASQVYLVEILKEKRRAFLSSAVTKGLDPLASMKPSGKEWIGDVPKHWSIAPLKSLIHRIDSGTSVNAVDVSVDGNQVGVLKTSSVYRGDLDPAQNKAVVDEDLGRVSCPLTAGTLIVSRMNTQDLIGSAGWVRESKPNLFLPDRLWQLTFKEAEVRFVHAWTRTTSYRAQVEAACTGTSSSMKNLSQNDFLRFLVAVPPRQEQTAIVSAVDIVCRKIDALIAEAERAIELLEEHHTALISAAVTGKIDVRGRAEAAA